MNIFPTIAARLFILESRVPTGIAPWTMESHMPKERTIVVLPVISAACEKVPITGRERDVAQR